VAAGAVRVTRLGRSFITGLLLWGLPLANLALTPVAVIAYLALVVVGIGKAVVDVSGFTLVTRLAGPGTAGKALGALEFVALAGLATGSILTPALLHSFGVRGTLVLLDGGLAGLALAHAVASGAWTAPCPSRARRPECFATSRGQPPSPRSSH
jgi:MFS family permease